MIRCILLDGTDIEIQSLKEINEKGIATQIKELYCWNNQIITLKGLEKCVNLQKIDCSGNQLTTLEGIENCRILQRLYCNFNQLETLEGLEKCVNLQRLYCVHNKLETLKGLDNCRILQKIDCNYNKLTTLKGLEKCVNLQGLCCDNNKLITLELKHMLGLLTVDFYVDVSTSNITVIHRTYICKLDHLYDNIDKYKERILIENDYDNFKQCQYFKDHKKEFVEKYNLVEFYDEIYLINQNTEEYCSICIDDTFELYIRCVNGHVICEECYELCQNKRECCVCRVEYEIKDMYYSKN